ncbi:MAG: CPBP family intramembrane glutamic endopeptidase [Candidatus Paceibacterota bacterium]
MFFKKITESSWIITLTSILFVVIGQMPIIFSWIEIGNPTLYLSSFAFMGMLVLPLSYIKLVLKKDLKDFGFRLPVISDNKKIIFLLSLLLILSVVVLSFDKSFQDYYTSSSVFLIFLWEAVVLSFIYYFSEEFLFRGFLFFGLLERIGLHSFWVSSSIFALFHIGKPSLEVFYSFLVGIIFCYFSYKTKSFVIPAVVHFLMALVMNVIITFVLGVPPAGRFTF